MASTAISTAYGSSVKGKRISASPAKATRPTSSLRCWRKLFTVALATSSRVVRSAMSCAHIDEDRSIAKATPTPSVIGSSITRTIRGWLSTSTRQSNAASRMANGSNSMARPRQPPSERDSASCPRGTSSPVSPIGRTHNHQTGNSASSAREPGRPSSMLMTRCPATRAPRFSGLPSGLLRCSRRDAGART